MKHDRLFKELISNFFYEFLQLFFASLAAQLDTSQAPDFLDKESFGQLPGDSRREKDLVVRVRRLGAGDAFIIIHLEHEAQNTRNFPQRMHLYASRLLERYGLPIYPIAVFSKRSRKPRPGRYLLIVHDLQVLDFRYHTVELAQLDWRQFLNRPSPVTSALMARMKIDPPDRPRVKLQCLRMLASLRLNPAKSGLISRFVDSYLRLNAKEIRIFDHTLEQLPQEERQEVMRFSTSWEEIGYKKGRAQGQTEGLRRGLELTLKSRFGASAEPVLVRLAELDLAGLEKLYNQLARNSDLSEITAPQPE